MAMTDLPYELSTPNDDRWTSEAYEALVKGLMQASVMRRSDILTAQVAGPCPRCRHEVNASQILDAVTGERSEPIGRTGESDAAEAQFLTFVAACRCGGSHDGRPENLTAGCGINFLVDIELPG
jgi:hypothetical protein